MNSNQNYISIITPNFNGEKYLEETIISVISQSNKKFEYIIIDGGSTDQSLKIINKYKNYISYFHSQKDRGNYDAVDIGIRKSKGNIIIWINSDDLLHKDAVDNVYKVFNKNQDVEWVNGVNGYIKKKFKFSTIPYYYPKSIIESGLAHKSYYGFLQQESIVFKKDLYLKSGGLDILEVAADYKLWLKFIKISKLNTFWIKIGYFRTHNKQLSFTLLNKYKESTGIQKKYKKYNFLRIFLSLLMSPYFFVRTFF